ncbi:MAG: DUF362 domain-containing protein [Anaerolineae bacterium]
MKQINRREFLTSAMLASLAVMAARCAPNREDSTLAPTEEPQSTLAPTDTKTQAKATTVANSTTAPKATPAPKPTVTPSAEAAYLAVVRGEDPIALTTRAIAAIGGIERFVKSGYNVIIKPNICNANNGPEYASTTNPDVVAALVKLCLGAGAKRVRVMDSPFDGTARAAYARSGIEAAVKAAGGEMELMAPMGFITTSIPDGIDLKEWVIYQPILEADLVINVPIAKNHGLARLTLAGKNLMGVIEDRGSIHRNMGQRIADLTSVIRPQLTVIDAVRILMANGPTGGDLRDVKLANTVIASHDLVACDAYATSLFGLTPNDIGYIKASAKMGLGQADLSQIKVEELTI